MRAERVITAVPAYRDFTPNEVTWAEFCERWAPGLARDGILVGVNWSGPSATGFDITPAELIDNVQTALLRNR